MHVSIIRTDPHLKSDLLGVMVLLYIPIEDLGYRGLIDPHIRRIFDVSEKYIHIRKYVEKLEVTSRKFDIHIDILDALVRDGLSFLDNKNLLEKFPHMWYNNNILYGVHRLHPHLLQLDNREFLNVLYVIRGLYEKCKEGVSTLLDGEHIPEIMKSFMKNHNYDICNEIYDQCRVYKDEDYNIHIRKPGVYENNFNSHNADNCDIMIRNVKTGECACIGGLTYNNITSILDAEEETPSHGWFNTYVRRSLNQIGLQDVLMDTLYRDIVKDINMYRGVGDEVVTFNDDDESDTSRDMKFYPKVNYTIDDFTPCDDTLSDLRVTMEGPIYSPKDTRYAGCTIGQLPKIQGTIDKDYAGSIEDDCSTDISMDDLKWLLLYLMDMNIKPNINISHALPVYVYKDNIGKLSATFNYMEPLNDGLDEYVTFNTFRSKFEPAPVSDIMSYYDSAKMYEYKRYIGTRPDIRVIIDDDIIIN